MEWPEVRMREWDWRRDWRVEIELGRKRSWIGWLGRLDGGDSKLVAVAVVDERLRWKSRGREEENKRWEVSFLLRPIPIGRLQTIEILAH